MLSAKIEHNQILIDLANDILEKCRNREIEIRSMGGLGIYFKCVDYQDFLLNNREPFSDIDFLSRHCYMEAIERMFLEMGYEQNNSLKTLQGNLRRVFYTPKDISIEIYLENLQLCQEISIGNRIDLSYPSLSITDLFLSKIQRVDLLDKDLIDLVVLLMQHSAEKVSDKIDFPYITEICSKSWNWWKTITDNLKKIEVFIKSKDFNQDNISREIEVFRQKIISGKRSFAWQIRNLVGDKIRWYRYLE